MNSPHLEEDISAYISGELGAEERAAVEKHLAECAACRDQYKTLRDLQSVLSDAPPLIPSPQFVERVLAEVRKARTVLEQGFRPGGEEDV